MLEATAFCTAELSEVNCYFNSKESKGSQADLKNIDSKYCDLLGL